MYLSLCVLFKLRGFLLVTFMEIHGVNTHAQRMTLQLLTSLRFSQLNLNFEFMNLLKWSPSNCIHILLLFEWLWWQDGSAKANIPGKLFIYNGVYRYFLKQAFIKLLFYEYYLRWYTLKNKSQRTVVQYFWKFYTFEFYLELHNEH